MKLPKGISKSQKEYLKKIYEETFKNKKISLGEEKARRVARAKFYEESFKMFLEKEKKLNKQNKIKLIKKTYIKEDVDYKIYKAGNTKIALSTDEKVLEKFKKSERKGILRDMNDEYEQRIFFKVKEENPDIQFSPDMYYVIK